MCYVSLFTQKVGQREFNRRCAFELRKSFYFGFYFVTNKAIYEKWRRSRKRGQNRICAWFKYPKAPGVIDCLTPLAAYKPPTFMQPNGIRKSKEFMKNQARRSFRRLRNRISWNIENILPSIFLFHQVEKCQTTATCWVSLTLLFPRLFNAFFSCY